MLGLDAERCEVAVELRRVVHPRQQFAHLAAQRDGLPVGCAIRQFDGRGEATPVEPLFVCVLAVFSTLPVLLQKQSDKARRGTEGRLLQLTQSRGEIDQAVAGSESQNGQRAGHGEAAFARRTSSLTVVEQKQVGAQGLRQRDCLTLSGP